MKTIYIVLICILTGCTGSGKKFVGEDQPTMKEVYDKKFNVNQGLDKYDVQREIEDGDQGLQGHVRKTFRRLYPDFQYLPNPIMTMYIYPHLTSAGNPVPGYSTYFKLYQSDHIALPSEVFQPEQENTLPSAYDNRTVLDESR